MTTGFVQKDGTGSLFVNKDKKSDKHPDRTGTIMVEGRRYRIAGWIKVSGRGEQFLSLKVEADVPREPAVDRVLNAVKDSFGQPGTVVQRRDDLEDEIPF